MPTYSSSQSSSSIRSGSSRTSTGRTGSRPVSCCAPGYSRVCNTFQQKIDSFKKLCNQTRGSARTGRPTTSQLNTFANLINKGAVIHTVSPTQVNKWARSMNTTCNTKSPTSVKGVMCKKFGKTTIKACCSSKTGGFIVACSPTRAGKPFCFPC